MPDPTQDRLLQLGALGTFGGIPVIRSAAVPDGEIHFLTDRLIVGAHVPLDAGERCRVHLRRWIRRRVTETYRSLGLEPPIALIVQTTGASNGS